MVFDKWAADLADHIAGKRETRGPYSARDVERLNEEAANIGVEMRRTRSEMRDIIAKFCPALLDEFDEVSANHRNPMDVVPFLAEHFPIAGCWSLTHPSDAPRLMRESLTSSPPDRR